MNPSDQTTVKTPILTLRLIILGILLLLAIAPVMQTWFQAIIRQPGHENILQIITLLLLLISLWPKRKFFHLWKNIQPSGIGLLLVLTTSLGCFLWNSILHVYTLSWMFTILLLAGVFWSIYGGQSLYRALGWFCFSLFLIPEMPVDLRTGISIPLQLLSTKATGLLAGFFIPISVQGNIFVINGHHFEVTVACSGLNTWIGFLFAGLLWLLFETFRFRRLLFVLLGAPALALFTNSVRLFVTALAAYYASADVAIAIHTNLEYLLFPIGLVILALIGKKYHV